MSKLTTRELFLVRDAAIRNYVDLPVRAQLPGMDRSLSEDERRTLSYLDASISCLSRMGLINEEALEQANIRVFQVTNGHNVIDEEMEGITASKGTRIS